MYELPWNCVCVLCVIVTEAVTCRFSQRRVGTVDTMVKLL